MAFLLCHLQNLDLTVSVPHSWPDWGDRTKRVVEPSNENLMLWQPSNTHLWRPRPKLQDVSLRKRNKRPVAWIACVTPPTAPSTAPAGVHRFWPCHFCWAPVSEKCDLSLWVATFMPFGLWGTPCYTVSMEGSGEAVTAAER